MNSQAGRSVVISGVTRGLGRAMAIEFARLGHSVHGCGRSEHDIASLKHELGKGHDVCSLDVTHEEAVLAWARRILAVDGAPHLLVNNAAIINPNARLWEVPGADFDALMRINLGGIAHLIRAFVPSMIGQGSGVVVNFSSGWGRTVAPEVAPYCASKWGVEGLTKALATELPKGLAAVAFNPGIIDTEMLRSCFGESAGRYPGASEWAKSAVPFLLALGAKDNGKSVTAPGG
jgi:NAD(P)-dependent dehydrogenase (short-subunit alcohol dehydrogenase family)